MQFIVTDADIAGISILILIVFMFLAHIYLRSIIQPVHQLKRTMADILRTFSRYTYVIHYVDVIPPDLHSEVFEKLRRLSDQLYADISLMPKWVFNFPLLGKIFSLPKEEMVYKSARSLTATANWINVKHKDKLNHIVKNIQTACDNLGLYIDPKDRITNEQLNF